MATGETSIPAATPALQADRYQYDLKVQDVIRSSKDSAPERLLLRVTIPHASDFEVAKELPTRRGVVALGYRILNSNGGTLQEGRALLLPAKDDPASFAPALMCPLCRLRHS